MTAVLSTLVSDWSALYSGSPILRTVVGFTHVGGLIASAGRAVVIDRATIVAYGRDQATRLDALRDLAHSHRLVVGGLVAVIASGVLLAAADADTYLVSRVFWTKMACIGLLTINGFVMMRASQAAMHFHARAWTTLRRAAVLSLILWGTTTLLGAALPNVG